MKSISASVSRLAVMLAILAMTLASTVRMNAQEATGNEPQTKQAQGVPWDWTHHHIVYSNPGGADEAIRNGTYERWLKITTDPRYIMQQRKRSARAKDVAPDASAVKPVAPPPSADADVPNEAAGANVAVNGREMTLEERNAQSALRGLPSGIMRAIIPPPIEQADAPRTIQAGVGISAPPKPGRIKTDWSETLGPTGTAGAAGGTTGLGEFPATFTSGGTSCSDFAIFNNGLAGATGQANIIAYDNLYSGCSPQPNVYWAYNTGTTGVQTAAISNATVLSVDGSQVAFVQFAPYATAASGTLTANVGYIPSATYTITVGSVTYTWETTTSITTVNQMSTHGIGTEGEIAQTIYAVLTGLRSNCPSTNTTCISASQTANSSVTPTLSGETVTVTASCGVGTCGNAVVFTQEGGGNTDEDDTGVSISPTTGLLSPGSGTAGVGGAQLVVLKWAAGGSLTSPATLTSNASYTSGCTAPCMIALPFSGTPTDSYSAPFISYGSGGAANNIYVGDDVGKLHKFQNIFSSSTTPTEVTTGGWPVTVNANASLGSPIYDPNSTLVFVGDYTPFNSQENCQVFAHSDPCGYLYSVNSSGTVVKSAQLDYNIGILDSPILDPTTENVYVFVGDDGGSTESTSNCTLTIGTTPAPCAAVYQFPVAFTSSAKATAEATVGYGYEFMMSGAFDNNFYNTGTGNLYVVGNTGPADNTLYQIPITSGAMTNGTANMGPVVATNYDNGYYSAGLQVSEFYNTSASQDYLFLSVLGFGTNTVGVIPCPSQSVTMGCIMGFDAPSGTISTGMSATGVLPEQGGTSGIVVDNGASGASNIYFSTLLNQSCTTSGGTNGCATQTEQSNPSQ